MSHGTPTREAARCPEGGLQPASMMHALLAVAVAALRAAPPAVSAGVTAAARVGAPARMLAPAPKGATATTLSTLEKVSIPLSLAPRLNAWRARARPHG